MSLLETILAQDPQSLALAAPGVRLSYAELGEQLLRIQTTLLALAPPGSRVGLRCEPGLPSALWLLATQALHVAAPLPGVLKSSDLKARLQTLRLDLVITVDPQIETAAQDLGLATHRPALAPPEPGEALTFAPRDRPALLLVTSGTTGEPRPIELTSSHLAASTAAIAGTLRLSSQDRSLELAPLHHIHGISTLLATLYRGGAYWCGGGFHPDAFPGWLQDFGITWYSCSPALHAMILESGAHRVSHRLRFLRSASAPMPPSLQAELEERFGVPLIQAYGMTQAAPQIASNPLPPLPRKPGSVGLPAGPQVKIQEGQILIRGANVVGEDWLATGDMGYFDEDGYLFVTGRADARINRGGESVDPGEVEKVLLTHPLVKEAACYPVDDPVLGQAVGAAVVLQGSLPIEDQREMIPVLRTFLSRRLAYFKIPQDFRLLTSLPRTSTHKIRIGQLAQAARADTQVARFVQKCWCDVLGVDTVHPDDNFFHQGGHSLGVVRFLNLVNEEFGLNLQPDVLYARPALNDFTSYLERLHRSQAPLTRSQQGMVFVHKTSEAGASYLVSASLRLHGDLDVERLRRTLEVLIERHPALRCRIDDTGRRQMVEPSRPLSWTLHTGDLLSQELTKPLSPTGPSLFRLVLSKVDQNSHQLVFLLSHLICDGWSAGLLRQDLVALYQSLEQGPPPSRSWLDWARSEKAWLCSSQAQRERTYWARRLANAQPLALEDRREESRPRSDRLSLEEELWQAVRAFAAEHEVTPFLACLAALQATLAAYSPNGDVSVGVPVGNRPESEWESVVGQFANLVVLRNRLSALSTWKEALGAARSSLVEALAHQRLPFEEVLNEVAPSQRTSLVQVVLAYQDLLTGKTLSMGENLKAEPLYDHAPGSKHLLTLYLYDQGESVQAFLNYDAGRLSRERVTDIKDRFRANLDLLIGAYEEPTGQQEGFLAHLTTLAWRSPQQCAVRTREEVWTYRQLLDAARELSLQLQDNALTPGSVVAFEPGRDGSDLIAILSFWMCGAAYLPLDRSAPEPRKASILREAQPTHLFKDGTLQTLSGRHRPGLAYLMPTSGTTGVPKIVPISWVNMEAYRQHLGRALDLRASDIFLHTASLSFSSSVRQFLLPWSRGATVLLAGLAERQDPALLSQLVDQATVVDLVPTHWRLLLKTEPTAPSVRLLLSASEPLDATLAERIARAFPAATLIPMYGQTETSGIALLHNRYRAGDDDIPLGRPLDCLETKVDEGELWLKGATVSLACCNRDGWYRTGDKVVLDNDGRFLFRGRKDNQVKVRGHRVDPHEVESALLGHPLVKEAAVHQAEETLRARVVGEPYLSPEELRRFLRDKLPSYMVPRDFDLVASLPRTASGKVARAELHETGPTLTSRLTRVWEDVLGRSPIQEQENFFDLGGDSVVSLELVEKARQAGLALTLQQLFEHQTIAELSNHIRQETLPRKESGRRLPRALLCSLCERFLVEAGLSPERARVVVDVQCESSLRGQPTHNLGDIPRYAKRLKSGVLNARPTLKVMAESPTTLSVDGDNGPGQWVASEVMELCLGKASQNGLCLATVKGSNHFGAAGHYAWRAAQEGYVAFCTTNGPVILAPTGGTEPLFGNNPIALGLPREGSDPVVLDIALSVAPRGKIGLQLREGRALSPGWILDSQGRPSTDLADLAAGLGVPIGEHKGSGLAFMMEVLAGVLSGSGFGLDHTRDAMKAKAADIGHFFLVFAPALFPGGRDFEARVSHLIHQIKSSKKATGVEEILLPGELENRSRKESLQSGVWIRESHFQSLRDYALSLGWSDVAQELEARALAVQS